MHPQTSRDALPVNCHRFRFKSCLRYLWDISSPWPPRWLIWSLYCIENHWRRESTIANVLLGQRLLYVLLSLSIPWVPCPGIFTYDYILAPQFIRITPDHRTCVRLLYHWAGLMVSSAPHLIFSESPVLPGALKALRAALVFLRLHKVVFRVDQRIAILTNLVYQ